MPKKSSSPDDSEQLGLELGGDLQSTPATPKPEKAKKAAAYKKHPGRLERVTARDWLESSIAAKNGDDECYRICTSEITKTAFGVTPRNLYKLVGGKPGDRDTLPVEMQNKLMVHELTIAPRLDAETIVGVDQSDTNDQILHIVSTQSKATEQFLRKHDLYQNLVQKHSIAKAEDPTNSKGISPATETPSEEIAPEITDQDIPY